MDRKTEPQRGAAHHRAPHPPHAAEVGVAPAPSSPLGSCWNSSGREGAASESLQQAQNQSPEQPGVILFGLEEVAGGLFLPGHHPRKTHYLGQPSRKHPSRGQDQDRGSSVHWA